MKRRKFIRRMSLGAFSLAVPTSAYFIHTIESYMPVQTTYTRNLSFAQVPGTEDYPGTPRDQKGLFMNEEHLFWPNMRDALKWQTSSSIQSRKEKRCSSYIGSDVAILG